MLFKSRFTTPAVAVISFCLIGGTSTAPAYADLGDQLFKLLANDGAAFDRFGSSVAINGAIAIIGAPFDDDNGDISGSAYLFDTTAGRQTAKLLPIDGTADDQFGWSVVIGGPPGKEIAVVGAPFGQHNGARSGSVYVFDISSPANPVQIAQLVPEDGTTGGEFGNSVGISGTIAIVGAPFDSDPGLLVGSAYLFDTTTAKQIHKLLPKDGAKWDYFGNSVAISGGTAIVGAPQAFNDGNGSAYLFDTTTGQQLFKLLPNDGAELDHFGWSVAISGTTAIVGATGGNVNSSPGAAYLFDIVTGQQLFKLLANDGVANDRFGWSVAISGNTAIVGARTDDDNGNNSGSAYFFDAATGDQIIKLLPNDGSEFDLFGYSVAISGTTAIVGAIWNDNNNGDSSGSAYLFDAAAPGKCPWDLDDSGSVGASDLLTLLASWGPCKGCPADFDGSGNVGASDLLAFLANWGPCP